MNQENSIKNKILNVLQNTDKYITRSSLVAKTYTADRYIRRSINELRKEGYPIISSSYKKGYKLAANENELAQFIAENRKRASDIYQMVEAVEKAYGEYNQKMESRSYTSGD